MSYRRRHRWFRRMALGLAFASVMFAGRASVAAAKIDPGTGGSRYVAAGGWSGEVDPESGIPLSAGIPHGDEQFIDPKAVQVVPYLSQGILTQEQADAAAAQAIHDPYLTDVFVRPGESLGGPDGDAVAFANALQSQQPLVIPYLSHGMLTEADALAAAATAIHDPYPTSAREPRFDGDTVAVKTIHDPYPSSARESRLDGDTIAFANAIQSQQPTVIPYLSHGMLGGNVDPLRMWHPFSPGVTDFPTAPVSAATRPDDRADRFAHSDVTQAQPVSSSGSSVEWNDALTLGIGVIVLALGLGLALGYLRRPRLAGL
jgi:hypothetical protein